LLVNLLSLSNFFVPLALAFFFERQRFLLAWPTPYRAISVSAKQCPPQHPPGESFNLSPFRASAALRDISHHADNWVCCNKFLLVYR
jgi:hypothetical protein